MKKSLLLFGLLLVATLTIQAQSIVSFDYGEGLAYPINEERTFDFDGDGYPDMLINAQDGNCLLYTSPSPRDGLLSRMPSSA